MKDRYENFTIQIAKISQSIRKIKTEEMAKYNLKCPHISCLYYLLKNNGTLTAKQLCDKCDEDKAAVSRSIKHLESIGLITCDSKLEKRYNSPLALTDKGTEVGIYIAQRIDSVLEQASIGLTEENRKIFYESLFLISNNLQKICDKYGE